MMWRGRGTTNVKQKVFNKIYYLEELTRFSTSIRQFFRYYGLSINAIAHPNPMEN